MRTDVESTSGNVRTVSAAEAVALIADRGLRTPGEAWHYSWNLPIFFDELRVCERSGHTYVFHEDPIHEWAPAPLFSSDRTLDCLIARRGKVGRFWFLHLSDFHGFLTRRSTRGRHSSRHFPSLRTYDKYLARANCNVEQYPLTGHEAMFVEWYDRLKDPKYQHSGAACLQTAFESNVRTPRDWFQFQALRGRDDGVCYAVQLAVEDGRSCSGINLASVLDKNAYGIVLAVEVIRLLSERRFSSFDCGVSETYSGYKTSLFLDTMPVDNTGTPYFLNR